MTENLPTEVLTKALVREIDLGAFGFPGTLALITLDNGADHNRPNTFGAQSLALLNQAIAESVACKPAAIAITGKPFIFAAGADLSALAGISTREEALAIGKLGHKVFRQLGEFRIKNRLVRGVRQGLDADLEKRLGVARRADWNADIHVRINLTAVWFGGNTAKNLGRLRGGAVECGLGTVSIAA